jgi:6-phosphofructo-2-kinase/fructose-2,6-biphosphatase
LEKYVVPTTSSMGSGVYAANLTENPRSLLNTGMSSNNDTTLGVLHNLVKGDASPDHYANTKKV